MGCAAAPKPNEMSLVSSGTESLCTAGPLMTARARTLPTKIVRDSAGDFGSTHTRRGESGKSVSLLQVAPPSFEMNKAGLVFDPAAA